MIRRVASPSRAPQRAQVDDSSGFSRRCVASVDVRPGSRTQSDAPKAALQPFLGLIWDSVAAAWPRWDRMSRASRESRERAAQTVGGPTAEPGAHARVDLVGCPGLWGTRPVPTIRVSGAPLFLYMATRRDVSRRYRSTIAHHFDNPSRSLCGTRPLFGSGSGPVGRRGDHG